MRAVSLGSLRSIRVACRGGCCERQLIRGTWKAWRLLGTGKYDADPIDLARILSDYRMSCITWKSHGPSDWRASEMSRTGLCRLVFGFSY